MVKLFQGNRGELFLIDYHGRKAVLKRLRYGRPNTLKKEGALLRRLSPRYTPRLWEAGEDYLIMEYIEGISLKEAFQVDWKRAVALGLEVCHYLDREGISHRQLGRYHHLIYSRDLGEVRVIDFERAVVREEPRNLLQFIGFYLRGYDLRAEIDLYKRDPLRGFEAIRRKIIHV
ncbi:MAG: hypothetical protein GXO19_01045 [Epsilonproteobacteria bacterium]|nr:hypothetical protein [Campylobacterota bacterium]NPA56300.1 hypothetical protein [Campylobacterota bacterium]